MDKSRKLSTGLDPSVFPDFTVLRSSLFEMITTANVEMILLLGKVISFILRIADSTCSLGCQAKDNDPNL